MAGSTRGCLERNGAVPRGHLGSLAPVERKWLKHPWLYLLKVMSIFCSIVEEFIFSI